MHEWLVLPDLGARPWPDIGALSTDQAFAAGAVTVTLLLCAIVACAGWLARRRAARARTFRPGDPRRIWAELKQLRAECMTSTGKLEIVVAQLKDKAAAHLAECGASAQRLQRLQGALDERASAIEALERLKAELELAKARHALELQRKDEELSSRSDALATAEQTIALLRGMLDTPARAEARIPSRVAG